MCRADPFAKKDWYDIKAPSVFQVKNVGKTLVSRTQGTKVLLFEYSTGNWDFPFLIEYYWFCVVGQLHKS